MSRTSAREYALKVLYSRELNPESEPIEEETLRLEEKDKAFADALIEAAAHEDVDKFYHSGEDRPDKKVIINEAIELAKTFGGEDSYRFINGLLDKALQGE